MTSPHPPHILKFGDSGWMRVAWTDEDDYRVLARTEQHDGRMVITDLIVRSPRRVDSQTLKSVPIGWLEGLLNSPDVANQFDTGSNDRLEMALTEVELILDEMTTHNPQLRPSGGGPSSREPLQRPDGSDPDFFYRQVAEAYQDILRRSQKIAPVMAEEAEVPVTTARRWIQEARRRGYLPTARRGRAG